MVDKIDKGIKAEVVNIDSFYHQHNLYSVLRKQYKIFLHGAIPIIAFLLMIKDINPNTDFVIVCLWDWDNRGNDNCQWDLAPNSDNCFFANISNPSLMISFWNFIYSASVSSNAGVSTGLYLKPFFHIRFNFP